MKFFKKRLSSTQEQEVESKIEIVAAKEATQKTVEQVKQANEVLQKVIDQNHFRIYIAVGGNLGKGNIR